MVPFMSEVEERFEQLERWWSEQPVCCYCGVPVAWNPEFILDCTTKQYIGSWIHSDGNKGCEDGNGVAWPTGNIDTKGKPFWGYNMLAKFR
jgi:hypothetical protein